MTPSASLLLSIPFLYALATLLLWLPATSRVTSVALEQRWRVARATAGLAPLLVGLAALAHLVTPGAHVARWAPLDAAGALHPALAGSLPPLTVRVDALSIIMLALVTTVAWVITSYSHRYLDGEPGQLRYLRAFFLTLAAVSLLVITNNLLVLVVCWSVSSIALHQLLTYYPDRAPALVAAHKKFLMSRVAEVALFGALVLLHRAFGTLEIDAIAQQAQALAAVPIGLEAAGALLAAGVILRSAQLPFHGWLIQVMEAPTPVSALLHAGIVNIGGFVLIRLAGLVTQLEVMQTLLVVVGGLTATLAAHVMTTRVSVKVGLAWSTAAQMGFMLLECGLGAYELALLHLVAHSLYKAHAFLSAGRTVSATVARRAQQKASRPSTARAAAAAVVALLAVVALDALVGAGLASEVSGWSVAFILALALTPLLARAQPFSAPGSSAGIVGIALLAVLAYLGLHVSFTHALAQHTPVETSVASLARLALVVLLFGASAALQGALRTAPTGALATRVYPAIFGGLYLDEVFTRLTFALWPPRSHARASDASAIDQTSSIGSAA